MAALPEYPVPRMVDLRHIRAADIEPLLEEEVADWQGDLHWDFRPSAELVRRFVDIQALAGFALLEGNRVIGYVYYVCEERKGLIGDVYISAPFRTVENENLLLAAALDALFAIPFVRRVESQLMMISHPLSRPLPMPHRAHTFSRDFMEIDLEANLPGPVPLRRAATLETWSESLHEETARVIALAYHGHVDSSINEQYRSQQGARRFLLNIIQYPGCGTFYRPGSFYAIDRATRSISGICLSSLVADQVGHITQICVTPEARGSRLGYEMMRRSLAAMAADGCRRASLTVTTANREAVRLYEQIGFRTTRKFAAYVWE